MGSIGEETDIPRIVGSSGREGGTRNMGFGRGMNLDIAARPPVQPESVPDAVAKSIKDFYGADGERAIRIYRASASSYPPHGDIETQFTTDVSDRCNAEIIAVKHSSRAATWWAIC